MCGILGVFGAVPIPIFDEALDTLYHRGPDGRGTWCEPGLVQLGHRRLTIRDMRGGAQPIMNEDQSIVAVVNGEFYDYGEQRRLLEKRGHVFSSNSDSELLIHWYEEMGVEALAKLRGEFAFILWDRKLRRLFAASDRFGIKPLVYTRLTSGWAFASEAKALFALGAPRALDGESAESACTMQYIAPTKTLFRGIERVAPGHYLLVSGDTVRCSSYWEQEYPDESLPRAADRASASLLFRDALLDAVSSRLAADVPIGVYLSGGVDSASVAVAAKLRGRPLKSAYTLSFDGTEYDECARARSIAAELGIPFQAVAASQADIVSELPAAVYFAEGLTVNGHLSAKYLLSKAARVGGCPVVLTGEGADELLAGYPHFVRDLPGAGAHSESATLARNPTSAGLMLAAGPALDTSAAKELLGFTPAFLIAKAGIGRRIRRLLSPDCRRRWNPGAAIHRTLLSIPNLAQSRRWSQLHRSMFVWNKLALSGYIIRTLGDGTEMAHGIEGRPPFLDHCLWRKITPLPASFISGEHSGKDLLRRAFAAELPSLVREQPKRPLVAPPLETRRSTHAGRLLWERLLTSLPPLFERASAERLLRRIEHLAPDMRKPFDPVLFTMLSLGALCDAFKLEVAA